MSLTEQLHDPVRLEQMQVAAVDETMQALEQFRPGPLDPTLLHYQLQAAQAELERERAERRRLQDALDALCVHVVNDGELMVQREPGGHLRMNVRIPLPASAARRFLAEIGSTRPAHASTAAPRIDTKDDGAGVPA